MAAVEHLPSGSNLYHHYLDQIQQVLAEKQWEKIKRVLLILVATQQAAITDFNLRTGSDSELDWQGISLEVLASLLGEEDAKSASFIFALYSLKEILRVERSRGDKVHYRLGIKEFSSYLQQHYGDELVQEHQSLAKTFHNDWQGRYNELETTEAATAYRLRYLLAHTELSADEELKQAVWGDEALADAYIGQGNQAYKERSDFAAAVAWDTCAIRIYERLLVETGRESLQNDLARAYMNRGASLYSQSELAKAVVDYGWAIQFQEQLRQSLADSKKAWPPSWQNDLAAAYLNRGNALQGQGELAKAVADYGRTIQLREKLRQSLADSKKAWPPSWQNDLAAAYMNRGVALRSQGELAKAVADYGRTIQLREKLRQSLADSKKAWPPSWQNDLAMAYMNRGIALDIQGELAKAMADYGRVIRFQEKLRQSLADSNQAWPPSWQNDLAAAYLNRGNALQVQGELAKAVADYGQAIQFQEKLHQSLADSNQAWPPSWQNELAAAYMNRGIALDNQCELAKAVADYGRAIQLMEKLRQSLADSNQAWPPSWQNELARAYMNRGVTLDNQCELAKAVADYGRAIQLEENLLFIQQFLPAIPDLAMDFYNLLLLSQQKNLPAQCQPEEWRKQATTFLQRLDQMLDVNRLPQHWQQEVEHLRGLLQ